MDNFLIKTVFFLLGVLSIQALDSLPSTTVLVLVALSLVISIKRAKWLACFLFGFIWVSINAVSVLAQQLPKNLEGQELLLQGEVVGLPVQYPDATRFVFKVESLADKTIEQFPETIRLSWYRGFHQLHSGESWQLVVKLKRPHGTANPHGFDSEQWMFEQGVGATGYVRTSKDNIRLSESKPWQVAYWRESLRAFLDKALAESPHLGIVKALVLGDRSDISQRQWRVFRETGTSHLIAISGLHIGLVSSLVFVFFQRLTLLFQSRIKSPRRIAIIAGLFAALAYAALAGFSIPTQRALVMVTVVMGALYWYRHYQPSRVIAIALWMVLLIDPLAVLSAGFWLSFFAVAIISYGLLGRLRQANFMSLLIRTQLYIAIGLFPVVLYFFQQLSLIAPLANIVAVPLVSVLLVPLLLLSLIVSLFSQSFGLFILAYVEKLLDGLWWLLTSLADIDYMQWALAEVSIIAAGLALLAVIVLLAPINKILKLLSLFLLLPLLFPIKEPPLLNGEYKVLMLDVGQGLSIVIHTKQHNLVFDTGAKYSQQSDLASQVILPYLKGSGISTVDKLVISHTDNDHAGGINSLLASVKIGEVLTSDPADLQSMLLSSRSIKGCVAGLSWQWDGVNFKFLHPSQYKIFKGNNASCVLRVSSENGSILLTGDIEKAVENSLLRYHRNKLKADVLIAPHHGSSSSSTGAFIKAVSPHIVLYPVGYLNRYGFPKEDVAKRYQSMKVTSFDSASGGAILVDFMSQVDPKVTKYRDMAKKYWSWQK